MFQPFQKSLLPLCAAALVASPPVLAATSTWTGGSSAGNNFSDSANWGGTALANNNSLVFAGSTRLTPNNDQTAFTYSGITFNSAASAFTIGGNPCTLAGNIGFSANPATVVTQTISLPLTIGANRTFGTQTNGVLVVNGGITAAGSYFYKNFPGTMILGGANNNFGNNNTLFCNEGTLIFGANQVITSASGTNSLSVNANNTDGLSAVADLAGTVQSVSALTLGSTTPVYNGLTNVLMDSATNGVLKIVATGGNGGIFCYPGGSGFSNAMATISASLDVNGADRNFFVGHSPSNAVDLLISGPIINSPGTANGFLLYKPTGYTPGVVMLTSTNNSYDGTLSVRDDTLILGANNTLPTNSGLGLVSVSGGSPVIDLYGTTNTVKGLTLGAGNATTVAGATGSIIDSVGGGVLKLGANNVTYNAGNASFQNGTMTVSATLDLNGADRSFVIADSTLTSVEVQVNGAIINSVGTAGVTKNNSTGVLVLAGTNTFNGNITINGGTLQIGGSGSLGSGNYAGTIGIASASGGTFEYSSSANQNLSNKINNGGALTKDTSSSSILTLSFANTYLGKTTVSAGLINLNAVETAGSSGPLGNPTTLANSIVLAGGGLQFSSVNKYDYTTSGRLQIADGTTGIIDDGGQSVTFANPIGVGAAKTGALTKQGTGTLIVNGVNTFSGGTTINGGTFSAGNDSAFGTGPITVNSGAQIAAGNGTPRTIANAITLNGGMLRILSASSKNLVVSGGVTLAADSFFNLKNHDSTALIDLNSNPMTGGFGFTLTDENVTAGTAGSPVLRFSVGGNSYAGNTTIASGTLRMNANNALPNGPGKGNVILNGGTSLAGTLDLNGFPTMINGLSGTNNTVLGSVVNGSATPTTLTVGNGDATSSFSGVIQNGTGVLGLTKTGAGTLTLSAANTYNGVTTISGGTLALSGSGSVASPQMSIAPGATFDVSAITPVGYTLSGALAVNLSKTGATLTQGQMAFGAKTLAYGGTLTVVSNANSEAFVSGNSFTLFVTNGAPGQLTSWFSSVTVPGLPSGASGLSWDTNKLATSGVLDVYSFTTTPLTMSVPTNTVNNTVSASKMATHASSSRATAIAALVSSPIATPHGVYTVDGSGALAYTPNAGYNGPDNFNVTYLDGHGWQTLAVSVTVGTSPISDQSPNLLDSGTDGSGKFYALFVGATNTTYTVETNSLLSTATWAKYANYNTGTNGLINVTNVDTTASPLFFRTVWPSY